MGILEKAKELAEEISSSPELRRVKEAELRLMLDLEAREIIEEFQAIQMEAINSGVNYEDLPEDVKGKLEELESSMNKNQIIKEYMTLNQELNQILEAVNMMITSALNENQEDGHGSCCSESCGEGSCCSNCGI